MSMMFNEDYLVCSAGYGEVMNGTVLPRLKEKERQVTVAGYEGRPLYCVAYDADQPAGTVVIVHGFTENALKYAELIWSLLHLHFSVIAYDQRGHGRSWREDGLPDISVTHVEHFDEYVEDLHIVCESLLSGMPVPHLVFAHSMGGAVASLFLERFPGVFSGAVLSSPMIAPDLGGFPAWSASALGGCARLLGLAKKNPFFMKPWSGPEDFATSCATDPERFAWYDGIKTSYPEFRNSIPSYQWSLESIRVTGKILAPGEPEKISCPVLICTADTDHTVLPGPQRLLAERIPLGRQLVVRNAKHEIFRSRNDVLFPWWHEVTSFFRSVVPAQHDQGVDA